MEHIFVSDGNPKQIRWAIESERGNENEIRDQPDTYLDKVSTEQAKFIALHAGFFWCIGRFIIKNGDTVRIKLDSESMCKSLEKKESADELCFQKIGFLNQLIDQRKLVIKYEIISPEENPARLKS